MAELLYWPEAENDLIEGRLYIAEDKDPETADRILSSVWDKCSALLKSPEMGRQRDPRGDELSPGVRSIRQGSYVIFYRLARDGVEIAGVLHGARDIEGQFQDD